MNPQEYTVLIGSITKNVGEYLPGVLKNIETYAGLFRDHRVFFVDGHSTDHTAKKIKKWCAKDAQRREFHLQPSKGLERMDAICEARNMMLDLTRSMWGEKTLLLLLDADSPNVVELDVKGFLTCFESAEWTALFANQPTCYYDVWALRDEVCPRDFQLEMIAIHIQNQVAMQHNRPDLMQPLDQENFAKKYQTPKPRELGLWPVESAFGGAGMYRTDRIGHAKYIAYQQVQLPYLKEPIVRPVCEHVAFHSQLPGKMFVNCQWMIGDHQ